MSAGDNALNALALLADSLKGHTAPEVYTPAEYIAAAQVYATLAVADEIRYTRNLLSERMA